ncbi:MFS transporter [Dactylosporangium sp. CA-139114]|uniref:MFS transporter n=1 Tax=Dactylosporangium sp. CA-139114 TaxID=3239931 RepID=UPI003D98529E
MPPMLPTLPNSGKPSAARAPPPWDTVTASLVTVVDAWGYTVDVRPVDRARLLRARIATSLAFLLFGTALGAWTSRIPAVKERLGLSDGRLSFALLAFAAGCIVGMSVLGRLSDRFGSDRVMVPTALGEGVLLIPAAFAPNLVTLCLVLFVFGTVHGTLNIAMNANATEVQRAWGAPIMSSFHAVYSIGGFLGAVAGGLFARADLGPGPTFTGVGAAVVVLALWVTWWRLPAAAAAPAEAPAATPGADRRPVRSLALVFLGVLAMFALVGEGAAADWSAVYVRDNLHSSAGFATYAFAAFSIAMTVARLCGDWLTRRLGPVLLMRISGVLAAAGLGTALLVAEPVAGVIGFAFLGGGMACAAPQIYSAAGNRDPARAGRALSLVVTIAYLGFVLGPILIGAASTVVGLPVALGIPVVLALVMSAAAGALRPKPEPAARTQSSDPVPAHLADES